MVKRIGGALLLSLEIDRSSPNTVSNQLYTAMREFIGTVKLTDLRA
jgi:hypothetical protein